MTTNGKQRQCKRGQSLNICIPEGDAPVFTFQLQDDLRLATSAGRLVPTIEYPRRQVHIPSAVRVAGNWRIPPAALAEILDAEDLKATDEPLKTGPAQTSKTPSEFKQSSKDLKSKSRRRDRGRETRSDVQWQFTEDEPQEKKPA